MSPRTLGLLLALAMQPGASQTQLSRRLRIDRTTMSQLIDDLTRGKLVRRTSLADDRRSHQLALTAKGSKALQQGFDRARRVEDAITEQMDSSRLSALKMGLLELLERSDTQ
nr:helix-turn-helix domain-containing protein [Mycolicibacterium hodleri]